MIKMWWIIGILSLPIALKWAKEDVQSMKTDYNTTVTSSENGNQRRISENFINICKTLNIKLDEKNRPIHKQQCALGIEFLQYKGHSDDTIDVFYNMYMERYNDRNSEIQTEMQQQNDTIKNSITYNIMVFRHDYYGIMDPEERIDKLKKQSWGDMVYQSRYIHGMNSTAEYTEVWTLKVPTEFKRKDLKTLYTNACIQADIDVGNFME